MSTLDKLIPITSSNSVYYAYPKDLMTKEMSNYLKSFVMEKPIFSRNPQLRGRTEKVSELSSIPNKGLILIPRFLGEMFAKQFAINIRKYVQNPNWPNFERKIEFTKEPREGQNEICLGVIDYLESVGGVTLKLDTGCGKTWIISKLVWNYWSHTIIFVSSKDQQSQVCSELGSLIPGLAICKAGGSASSKDAKLLKNFVEDTWEQDYPFICVSVNKTANNLYLKYGLKFWEKFRLSIYDECQSYCNDTGIALLKTCQTQFKVAMSATPDVNWNSNLILLWCGPLFDGNPFMPKRKFSGKVKIIKYYGPKHCSESQKDDYGTNSYANTLRLIETDEFRIDIGLEEISILHGEGLNPIVFFQHLDYMHLVADKYAEKYGTRPGILEGKSSDDERVDVKGNSEIIFTTYTFGGTALNIPRVKSMILMEPHKTRGKQVNGRPLRDDSDTIRKYVDIVDMVSFLGKQLSTRMEDYRARNFEISEIVIKVPDPKKN